MLFVIKIGGQAIDHAESLARFLRSFAGIDARKILVHGGGAIATKIGERLGIVSRYVDGRRITDARTLDLVTMVYGGLVNKRIVAQLQSFGCNALGLTGADADCIPAIRRPVGGIDYGFAGDVTGHPNTDFLQLCLESSITPVFAPLTHDGAGSLLNTNADTVATSLAIALGKFHDVRLIFCFGKRGVLRDPDDDSSVIGRVDAEVYRQLLRQGALSAGMLPKLESALGAIEAGVREVVIGHADDILANAGSSIIGTSVTQ